jgi:ribosome-binding protein aMBF1 (putative translation factor)
MTTRSYCNQALIDAGLPVEAPKTISLLTRTPFVRPSMPRPDSVRIDGDAVREFRLAKGPFRWTQRYLAARAGMNHAVISGIENSRHPRYMRETAQRIADALGVDLDDILADSRADVA